MKYRGRATAVGLLTLLLAAIVGLVLTRDSEQSTSTPPGKGKRPGRFLVDESPVLTARALAQFATASDERIYAEEALASADHEVELAFTGALRDVKEHPVAMTPASRELYEHASQASAQVAADQERADQLAKQLAQAKSPQKEAIQSQLDVANAQLLLDRDELQDAKQDLVRVVGDVNAITHSIQRQLDRHKLFEQHGLEISSTEAGASNSDAGYDAGNLVAQVAAWHTLSNKTAMLQRAIKEAYLNGRALSDAHDALADRARETLNPGRTQPNGSPAAYRLDVDPEALADLSTRGTDEADLLATYRDWLTFAASRQRVALKGIVRSLLWIIFIVPSMVLIGRAITYLSSTLRQRYPH